MELKDKNVLVLGLGETGLSALRWLERQGARLSVADTRENPPGIEALAAELPTVKVYRGAFTVAMFNDVDLIVVSPGVSLKDVYKRQDRK